VGLLDEITEAQAVPTKRCKTQRLIDNMAKDDANDLKAALQNPSLQTEAIVRVLVAHGYSVSTSQLASHRRGLCCCVTSG